VFSPAARGAVRQQPVDQLGDQVAVRVIADQGIQQDGIRAPVGAEQQVGLVVIVGGEVGRSGGLDHPVVDMAADGASSSHLKPGHPAAPATASRCLHGQVFQPGLVEQAARLGRVAVAHQVAHVQRIGAQGPARPLAVPVG
jgi:hypothetical protein